MSTFITLHSEQVDQEKQSMMRLGPNLNCVWRIFTTETKVAVTVYIFMDKSQTKDLFFFSSELFAVLTFNRPLRLLLRKHLCGGVTWFPSVPLLVFYLLFLDLVWKKKPQAVSLSISCLPNKSNQIVTAAAFNWTTLWCVQTGQMMSPTQSLELSVPVSLCMGGDMCVRVSPSFYCICALLSCARLRARGHWQTLRQL